MRVLRGNSCLHFLKVIMNKFISEINCVRKELSFEDRHEIQRFLGFSKSKIYENFLKYRHLNNVSRKTKQYRPVKIKDFS